VSSFDENYERALRAASASKKRGPGSSLYGLKVMNESGKIYFAPHHLGSTTDWEAAKTLAVAALRQRTPNGKRSKYDYIKVVRKASDYRAPSVMVFSLRAGASEGASPGSQLTSEVLPDYPYQDADAVVR
jgi:hypothetical protein